MGKQKGSGNQKKSGALSREEMEYIAKNVDRFTVEEIGSVLNRHPDPIRRYIARNKLGEANTTLDGDVEKTTHMILNELKEKAFYKNLRSQLAVDELDYFNEHWVAMVTQFAGDLLPSEEMELKELLTLEILKNREATAEKNRLELKASLEKEAAVEKKLLKECRESGELSQEEIGLRREMIRGIQGEITNLMVASSAYIKNFKDLCDRADKMRKALHASRQDRAKEFQNSKINFSSWLKTLDDYENRERVGKEMSVIKAAKDAELKKLGSYHTYSNKEVAKPILNAETVEDIYDDNDPPF